MEVAASPPLATNSRYSYACEHALESGFPLINTHRIIVKRRKLRARLSYLFALMLVLAFSYSVLFSVVTVAVGLQWVILLYGVVSIILQQNSVEEEAVVVMPTFGVQLETFYYSGKVHRRFVPLKRILAAVINEAVTPTSCYYYLALLLQDDTKLVLAFQEVRPPLSMLVPIWKVLCEAVGN